MQLHGFPKVSICRTNKKPTGAKGKWPQFEIGREERLFSSRLVSLRKSVEKVSVLEKVSCKTFQPRVVFPHSSAGSLSCDRHPGPTYGELSSTPSFISISIRIPVHPNSRNSLYPLHIKKKKKNNPSHNIRCLFKKGRKGSPCSPHSSGGSHASGARVRAVASVLGPSTGRVRVWAKCLEHLASDNVSPGLCNSPDMYFGFPNTFLFSS